MSAIDIPTPDPVKVREELAKHRKARKPFDRAWKAATEGFERCEMYDFMRAHFKAAYNGDESPKGRCMVPARDVSSAIPVQDFTRPHVSDPPAKLAVLPRAPTDSERCRSGDGCDRLAVRGRWGKTFCDYHAQELEGLTVRFNLMIDELNPRNRGNKSLGGTTRRAA